MPIVRCRTNAVWKLNHTKVRKHCFEFFSSFFHKILGLLLLLLYTVVNHCSQFFSNIWASIRLCLCFRFLFFMRIWYFLNCFPFNFKLLLCSLFGMVGWFADVMTTTNGNDVIFMLFITHMGEENTLQQVFTELTVTHHSVPNIEKFSKVIFYAHEKLLIKVKGKTCNKINFFSFQFSIFLPFSVFVHCTVYDVLNFTWLEDWASNSKRCDSINQFGFWIDINWLISSAFSGYWEPGYITRTRDELASK